MKNLSSKLKLKNLLKLKKNIIFIDEFISVSSYHKNDNKVLNFSIRKLFTKTTEKFVPDDERIATLSRFVQNYILELKK